MKTNAHGIREASVTLSWKHPVIVCSSLLPLSSIMELVLGYVMPKTRMNVYDPKDFGEFHSQLHCPHCGKVHDYLQWYARDSTMVGNWFGYYCNRCKGIIPCERTIVSRAILLITYPLRAPFIQPAKRAWLRWQERRINDTEAPVSQSPLGPLLFHSLFNLNVCLLVTYFVRIPFDALFATVRTTDHTGGIFGNVALDALYMSMILTAMFRFIGRRKSFRGFGYMRMTPMDISSS